MVQNFSESCTILNKLLGKILLYGLWEVRPFVTYAYYKQTAKFKIFIWIPHLYIMRSLYFMDFVGLIVARTP